MCVCVCVWIYIFLMWLNLCILGIILRMFLILLEIDLKLHINSEVGTKRLIFILCYFNPFNNSTLLSSFVCTFNYIAFNIIPMFYVLCFMFHEQLKKILASNLLPRVKLFTFHWFILLSALSAINWSDSLKGNLSIFFYLSFVIANNLIWMSEVKRTR